MASNLSTCGVCDHRQVTKPSIVWCSECDEGLCGDCNEHHSISKASRNHETVSITEYKKLPTEILQIAQFCKIHNEKYELFCRKHDCPCCKKCVKTHNDCKDLTDIKEIISNVKASSAFYDIEQIILELADNVNQIRNNREDNLKSLEIERRKVEAEIKQTRIKLNNHLDKLQDEVLKELMTAEQTESKKIHELLTSLKAKETEIAEYQTNIWNIKQHASELQAFLAIKHIEKDLKVEEKFIRSIITSDIMKHVTISYENKQSLQKITASVQKFGEINVNSEPCELSLQKRKERQAQRMVALSTRNINNLTVVLQKRINDENQMRNVRGCSLLPGGRMVFSSENYGKIIVFKSDTSKDFEINSIGGTFDVVFIGDDNIAVTSDCSRKITIIDIKNSELKKKIKVNSNIAGISYKDGHLIYCAMERGLEMISLSDESVTNLINTKLSKYSYVTTFGDKLFYTNRDEHHSVTCCDYHGNILWTFSNNVLVGPYGISVDNDGNVFVVGCYTNNVVVISPDGQRYRQLLSRDDGLNYPNVLHYDQSSNKLLVANTRNEAFLYEVK